MRRIVHVPIFQPGILYFGCTFSVSLDVANHSRRDGAMTQSPPTMTCFWSTFAISHNACCTASMAFSANWSRHCRRYNGCKPAVWRLYCNDHVVWLWGYRGRPGFPFCSEPPGYFNLGPFWKASVLRQLTASCVLCRPPWFDGFPKLIKSLLDKSDMFAALPWAWPLHF